MTADPPDPAALQPATPAHATVLAELHVECFPPGERWGKDAMALQLLQPGGFGLIHPEGAMVLARVAADEAEILTIAVVPKLRRQGVGRALLDTAMRIAAERGAARMFLEVSAANHPAQALYRALGFTEIGRRRRYYRDGQDALVLSAALNH